MTESYRTAKKTFVGARLRGLRNERGLTQVSLAKALNISPSYLNQLEHNSRPLTGNVLHTINQIFGVDSDFFDINDHSRLVAELHEVTLDDDVDLSADYQELTEAVAAHPDLARAMVALHRRYRHTANQLAQITNQRLDTMQRGSLSMPHEEVRDFFYQRHNYLDELDKAAEELTNQIRLHKADTRQEIANRLQNNHGVRIIRRIDMGDNILHRYSKEKKILELSSSLSFGKQVFKMAAELAYLEFGYLIDNLVSQGNFTSEESIILAKLGFANYFAAATLLPYSQFHGAAEDYRYDIERLSAFYAVSFETIVHRLSTLQRPQLRGVPFSFVRVDRAGNMSKRQSATGFHFAADGGTCPLWNVYETFAQPGKISVQIAQMPDSRNYLWVARTVERRASRYGQSGKSFAIGLGCELRHAHRLVYSEGLNLSLGVVATPIGAGCRVCERDNCPQRAFPALGRTLDLDAHRSTVSPYMVHSELP